MKINQESSPASSTSERTPVQKNQEASNCERALEQVKDRLVDKTSEAWKIFNLLEFMVAALPEDKPDSLPVHCTLVDLREDVRNLAIGLMDIRDNAG
ncbi:Flagellar protein FliT [Burkholderia cepacia]|uniref:hypothetical protein n=1 Tax=Burkholderia cepacia TaxID=292 RepID=UPI0039A64F76